MDRVLALRAQLRAGAAPVDEGAAVVAGAAGSGPVPGSASFAGAAVARGRAPLPVAAVAPADREAMLAELGELQRKLAELQGESPLILPSVDEQAVASVVADWTGVPVGRMVKNEVEAVLRLADTLSARVIGQRHGLEQIARRIQTSRAKLDNPSKPIGVFMLVGPSGVGKTETALALGGDALRRRAEPHHHQHERVPGSAHRLHLEGRAAGLCRLRRRRRADRGGAPPAVFGGAARRGREGASRRPRDLLPGVRQGLDGGRRGPVHRLQEHDHPADVQRRQRPDHEPVQGPGTDTGAGGDRQGAARAAAEGLPGGAARVASCRSRTSRSATRCWRASCACSSTAS